MGCCSETSCGQEYIKWRALKQLNVQGVYTPEQIKECVDYYWNYYAGNDTTVNQDTCLQIV